MYWLSWTEPERSGANRRTNSNRRATSKSVLGMQTTRPLHRFHSMGRRPSALNSSPFLLDQLGKVGNIDFEADTEILGRIFFRVGEDLGSRNYKPRLSLRGETILPALDPECAPAISRRRFVGEIDSAFAVLARHPAHDEEQAICISLSDHRDRRAHRGSHPPYNRHAHRERRAGHSVASWDISTTGAARLSRLSTRHRNSGHTLTLK